MAFHPDLTDEQRSNLVKLSAYLKSLPADYPDFAMDRFTADADGCYYDPAHVAECGTAACAAGHGPQAGIMPLPGERWRSYSERAFVSSDTGWDWCFGQFWSDVDNTAYGAAARIDVMLTVGVPDDADEQQYGDVPLSYTVSL